MTETDVIRRKRLVFRSWHRGTREADLVLGRFADRHVRDFTPAQLDPDLWDWLTGAADPPPGRDGGMVALLRGFRPGGEPT